MLRKSGVAVIILLVLVSLTIGSIDQVSVPSAKNDISSVGERVAFNTLYAPSVDMASPFFSNGILQEIADRRYAENPFTTVIFDLSDQGVYPSENSSWHLPGFMAYHLGILLVPYHGHESDVIAGRVIVQLAGNDTPQAFPVKFFKHDPETGDNVSFDYYRASLAFKLGHDENGSPSGLVLYQQDGSHSANDMGEAYFTVNGEISIKGPSVQATAINGSIDEQYTYNLTTGQTVWHEAQVTGTSTSFSFDIKWQNPDDDFRVLVYTPDGHVLGPYTDTSDNKKDGQINMEIDNPSGVADGTWYFKVTSTSVTGKDEYYIRTW